MKFRIVELKYKVIRGESYLNEDIKSKVIYEIEASMIGCLFWSRWGTKRFTTLKQAQQELKRLEEHYSF